MLRGDEKPHIKDMDNDGDDDILYLAQGKLYFKENQKKQGDTVYIDTNPRILSANDNPFFNGDIYYEAVNYFEEAAVSDGAINVEFQKPSNPEIRNFRLQYHTIVDRYVNDRDDFTPSTVKTHIVDALTELQVSVPKSETVSYIAQKHPATLQYVGAMVGLKLTTQKLENIKTQLLNNTEVTLTAGTPLYAGANSFRITYSLGSSDEVQELSVPAGRMILFTQPASITALSGDAYVSAGINQDIEGTDIQDYVGMPLLAGTKIQYIGNIDVLNESSHVDIRYADDSEVALDMRTVSSYTLYDLGTTTGEQYRIRLEIPNDFYYAQLRPFQDGELGTLSQQILLAPQSYSDKTPPQIGLNQKIRIPVYQRQTVDLTPYIYEDG